MSAPPEKKEQPSLIDRWKKSDNKVIALLRELLWVVVVVGAIALTLFLVSGTWPAVVTIESESMVPHMNVGDLVFVVQQDRFGPLETWASGKDTGYMKFGDYGDVIIYRRNGESGSIIPIPLLSGAAHPIIHRAMGTVQESKPVPFYVYLFQGQSSPSEYLPADSISVRNTANGFNGTIVLTNGTVIQAPFSPEYGYLVLSTNIAPNSGYITKGDNNMQSDQLVLSNPVQEDWVVGKALFTIPLLGYLPLNIVPVAIIIIVALFLYEWYRSRKKISSEQSSREQMKKQRGKSGK
jgi:signal peptidase